MISLNRVLLADAATCAATGALLAPAAAPLSTMLGLPADLLFYAGLSLFPCAALMLLASFRPSRPLVWVIILGNFAWVAGSVLVLFVTRPTGLGDAFVIGQAVVVAILAELERASLMKARSSAISA